MIGGLIGLCVAVAAAGWMGPAARADPPDVEPPTFTEILSPTPKFELRGRIEVDAVFAAQSLASQQQIGTLQDGYGFRRARLGAQGTVGDTGRWIAELEFSGSNVRLRDFFVGLTALPVVDEVRVGYFREPFSLDGATSSRFITFMERSPLNPLDPSRNWGICGYWFPDSERWTAAMGTFRDGTSSTGVSTGNQNAWALTGRTTALPVYDDGADFRLVHVGAAMSFRQPANGVVGYKPAPQNPLLVVTDNPPSPLLPPISVPANSQQIYNLQGAVVYGPLSVQSEWFGTAIQQTGAGVVSLHGVYLYGSYFLTGEHRGYNRVLGEFDRVAVRRPLVKSPDRAATGFGAVELAARFSYAAYTSPNLPPQPPGTFGGTNGAVLYEATWGVNWYLNDYIRIMANYALGIPEAAGSPVLPVHTFGLRTAVFW